MKEKKKMIFPVKAKIMQALLIHLRMNAMQLTIELGYTKGDSRITRIRNGLYDFTPNMAKKIVAKFPEISYDFLMTGIGSVSAIRQSNPLHHEMKLVKTKIDQMEDKIDFVYNINKK